MKRWLSLFIVAILCVGPFSVGSAQEDKPSGNLVVWTWFSEYSKIDDAYREINPNVTFEYVAVEANDYLTKIQQTYASGGDLPDILWAEIAFRAALFSMDIWENLDEAPYNLDESLFLDYIPSYTSNPDGHIIAFENAINSSVIGYKKDLAEQYLGTSDKAELEAMFKSYDDYATIGRKVSEMSGGEVKLFSGLLDVSNMMFSQMKSQPNLNSDGEIEVSGKVKKILDTVQALREADAAGNLSMWSSEWYASYGESKNILFPLASWSIQFQVEPNDPNGIDNWGMFIPAEGAFNWGGTAYGICNQSKNKEAAWDYLKWSLGSNEGGQAMKREMNFFLPLKSLYEDPTFSSSTRPNFGALDIGKILMEEAAPQIANGSISIYDNLVASSLEMVVQMMMADTSVTADEAMELFMFDLQAKVADIPVK